MGQQKLPTSDSQSQFQCQKSSESAQSVGENICLLLTFFWNTLFSKLTDNLKVSESQIKKRFSRTDFGQKLTPSWFTFAKLLYWDHANLGYKMKVSCITNTLESKIDIAPWINLTKRINVAP